MLRLETDCAPSSDFVVLHTLTQELNLYGNNIGDDGMRYLADAFAKGAMACLTGLSVDDGPLGTEHPALKAACEARGIELYELY